MTGFEQLVGGFAVSAFSILGDMFRPKSFAGLFGAAPSIALATLAIVVVQKGAPYAAVEGRSMMVGAFALLVYTIFVCGLLKIWQVRALPATLVSLVPWIVVAIGGKWLLSGLTQ